MSLRAVNLLLQVYYTHFVLKTLIDVELIKNNAKLGAEIAVSLSNKLNEESKAAEVHSSGSTGTKITIIGGAAVDIIAQSDSVEYQSG